MKLSKKELTKAIAIYARKHGYYQRTVRSISVLFYAAIAEYKKAKLIACSEVRM